MLPTLNPWVLLGLVLAWFASLTAVGVWQNHSGHITERVAWQQRAITEQLASDVKYKALESSYRQTEQVSAQRLADVATMYERKIHEADIKHTAIVSDLRVGAGSS